jgi:CheY-like chemotaxis protein
MNRECLIVDDEPDICWALQHLLASKGRPVQTAQTAQAALDLMAHHRFQLAFLDLALPDMNGLELADSLRQRDPLMRIVILSGNLSADAATLDQNLHEGLICACVTKPFLHEKILAVIQDWAAPGP